ncbi:MAG: RNA-guided endonuclease IscB [Candidatus Hodarchaeota archaeon]
MIFILNVNGSPLMPCENVIGRLLLKQGKVKVKWQTPFTIKLTRKPETEYVQKLTLGVDSGSGKFGSGVTDGKGNALYASEVEVRNDIKMKMDRRRKYRRAKRWRKCRYRKPRFLNRKNSNKKGRFSPTMNSKIESHLREIEFVKNILPIVKVIIETGTFDPHALKNPAVLQNPILYQKGLKYGFNNAKACVLHRDNYTCRHCKGKSGDKRLHCHHIVYKENGGSDEPENLVVLCKTCHSELHDGKIILKTKGTRGGLLAGATQMNSIRKQLLKRTKAIETFGFVTKTHRESLGLPKYHFIDALVVASQGKPIMFKNDKIFLKKCIPRGDYQQTKGVRSEKRIATGKLFGFRKFDKVRYKGRDYFIKGKRASGYFELMNIHGNHQSLKPIPKASLLTRISARTSWMVEEKRMRIKIKI